MPSITTANSPRNCVGIFGPPGRATPKARQETRKIPRSSAQFAQKALEVFMWRMTEGQRDPSGHNICKRRMVWCYTLYSCLPIEVMC